MVNQQEYIREQILLAAKNRVRAQSLPSIIALQPQEKSKFMTNFLMVCVILMGLMISLYVVSKQMKTVPKVVSAPQTYQPKSQDEIKKLEGRISWLESSLKECGNRVWVLAIAQSENTNMTTAQTKKYFPQESADYIVVDQDWKLSRMPKTLNFQEQHKEKLEKFIK